MIYTSGSLSQSDVVAKTGLQASTVFRIFTALEERELIRPIGMGLRRLEKRGRRPSMYELNPESKAVIGAEVSGTGISVSAINFRGDTLHHETLPLRTGADAEFALGELIQSILRVIRASGVSVSSIIGIGVGVPGVVDTELGAVLDYERFSGMNGLPIAKRIEKQTGCSVTVHNNASVIALAEYRLGRAQGTRSTAAFLLRAGMGGAYINDDRIVESHGRSVFEVGHLFTDLSTIAEGNIERPDVLESLLSERALLEHLRERTNPSLNWASCIQALRNGDPEVRKALKPRADLLAAVARNVALLLSPESFIIVTRFQPLSDFFAESVRAYFATVSDPVRLGVRNIIPLAYHSALAARGAAEMVLQGYFTRETPGESHPKTENA